MVQEGHSNITTLRKREKEYNMRSRSNNQKGKPENVGVQTEEAETTAHPPPLEEQLREIQPISREEFLAQRENITHELQARLEDFSVFQTEKTSQLERGGWTQEEYSPNWGQNRHPDVANLGLVATPAATSGAKLK